MTNELEHGGIRMHPDEPITMSWRELVEMKSEIERLQKQVEAYKQLDASMSGAIGVLEKKLKEEKLLGNADKARELLESERRANAILTEQVENLLQDDFDRTDKMEAALKTARVDALREAAALAEAWRDGNPNAVAPVEWTAKKISQAIEALAQQPQYNPEMVEKLHKLKDEKPVASFTDADALMNYLEEPKETDADTLERRAEELKDGRFSRIAKLMKDIPAIEKPKYYGPGAEWEKK